jgi:TIR domain
MRRPKLFLAYSSEDRPFALWLVARLKDAGIDVWFDQWKIAVGDSIAGRIDAGLQESDWLAVVLSPAAVGSAWVKVEIDAALLAGIGKRNAKILPILYRDCAVPPLLARLRYADCRGEQPEKGVLSLLDALDPERDLRGALQRHYRLVAGYIRAMDTADARRMALVADRIDGGLAVLVLLRYKLELRKQGRLHDGEQDLFKMIAFLERVGVSARSPVWGQIRDLRNACWHTATPGKQLLQIWKGVSGMYHELLEVARGIAGVAGKPPHRPSLSPT